AEFGLVNASQPAAPGLEPGMWSYDDDRVVANPEEYLFWDEVHPTAAGHFRLAERALQLVAVPGDFNRDGRVDAADYVVWLNSLGLAVAAGTAGAANGDALVDSRDYLLWRKHFGLLAPSAASLLHHVPEPNINCALICITAVAAGWKMAHRGRHT